MHNLPALEIPCNNPWQLALKEWPALVRPTSEETRAEKARSDAIDRDIFEDSKRYKKECKVLVLGTSESGKSTIIKQMKIIQGGYDERERNEYRTAIYKNVLDCVGMLARVVRRAGISSLPENVKRLGTSDILAQTHAVLTPALVDAVWKIWCSCTEERAADEHLAEFNLMDSSRYFFSSIHRIADPAYVPNEEDILHARTKTNSITETRFFMDNLSIHMFDVSGQHSERKKWIHCFESVTNIFFCAALSDYDQVLEEERVNRMRESLYLFESVINSRWFLRTSMVLFLTKIDVFKKKLPRIPLGRYFPEYEGGSDLQKATKYILWKYMQENRAKVAVYPHVTQPKNINIRRVFAAVKETIIQNMLVDSGILKKDMQLL
ncbi:heterotrimeric G-protein alpha subunit, GPA3-like protein [Mycena olivaceomarginata]|nr:heterotrimeric G-protein alpha subunit, GPA3-like protein [Mycena olivaceomarginata]